MVRAHGTDPLEVVRQLVHGSEQRCSTSLVELLGEEDVLGHLNGVLQQPMDEDDVDADELAPLPDGLRGDLADVCDELQLQVVRLLTPVARAQVRRDVPALAVERAVHVEDGLGHRGDRGTAVERVDLTREEGRVAFDLDQIEVTGRVDHRFEQPRGVDLGVGEAHPMGAHVLGVPADVGDQEERTLRRHGG